MLLQLQLLITTLKGNIKNIEKLNIVIAFHFIGIKSKQLITTIFFSNASLITFFFSKFNNKWNTSVTKYYERKFKKKFTKYLLIAIHHSNIQYVQNEQPNFRKNIFFMKIYQSFFISNDQSHLRCSFLSSSVNKDVTEYEPRAIIPVKEKNAFQVFNLFLNNI